LLRKCNALQKNAPAAGCGNSASGVNFNYVLRTAFTLVDPESVKIQLGHQHLFTFLGSGRAKVIRRTLVKLSPDFVVKNFAFNWSKKE